MKAVPHCLALTLLATAMQTLFASDASTLVAAQTLPTVVVTATRSEAPLDTLPPSVSAVGREEMDDGFVRDYTDLAKTDPDIAISRNPRYGLSSVNIRGLEGNRVLMLVDGIRLPDAFAFGPYQNSGRDLVDFDSLSAIEIVRGPASTLYGSDALGGVIGLRTLEPMDLLRGRGSFAGQVAADYDSSDDSAGTRATVAGMTGDQHFWLVQAGIRSGHEIDNQGENSSQSAARTAPNPQDYKTTSALAKLRTLLDGGHTLGVSADFFRRDTDAILYTDLGNPMTPTVRDSRAADETRRWRVSGEYDYAAPAAGGVIDSASVRVYAQQEDTTQKTLQTRTNAPNWSRVSEYSQDQLGLSAQAGKQLQSGTVNHALLVGAEILRSDLTQFRSGTPASSTLDVRDVPKTGTTQWGVFAQDEMRFGQSGFTLTPGLRYDHYELAPHTDAAFDKQGGRAVGLSDGKLSPKLLASWQANPALTLFAQYSHGFRAPNAMELNGSYINYAMGYGAVANPDLKPETSRGVELGARFGGQQAGGSVTVFDNRYKDFIEQVSINCPGSPACVPGAALIYQSQNQAKVRIYGAEARGHWEFAPGWRSWASVAYAVGENESTGEWLDSVAPLKGALGLEYRQVAWGSALTLSAADRHHRVSDDSYFKAPGYGVLDLTAWWEPVKDVRINAGVFNLADRKYWLASDVVGVPANSSTVDRYSQPGRNARVNVRWSF
ncbi:TonB-dependent hemoglobin/transferrin/lactoferrin family receptor [Chitinilyticum litopenaei]|uniref:TonB-dependent hemoglobin/transferrin/lactoferrin family receptor n=1 Tax=Chitinilyticum litopenaei TaxID=1121276 RepID=UPI00041E9A48|nr:TonB-dependent hemoglobin/transferrin/lactoferrin family receptor [Chitinilyticum litopenaei]